jgi:hypothetical protein
MDQVGTQVPHDIAKKRKRCRRVLDTVFAREGVLEWPNIWLEGFKNLPRYFSFPKSGTPGKAGGLILLARIFHASLPGMADGKFFDDFDHDQAKLSN